VSDYGPLLDIAFTFVAILCIVFWGFIGLALYLIYKKPKVKKKLFVLVLGVFSAPFVLVIGLVLVGVITGELRIMHILVVLLLLPVMVFMIPSTYLAIYYGASFASLAVGYLLFKRKAANKKLD
jgi:hypothetical protein